MATLNTFVYYDSSTLANFKLWAQTISNFMATAGWVQQSDTGQVNWSTVSVPGTNNSVYEIWKSGDALSSTLPIYLRIDYGTNSWSQPYIGITTGLATDGAGNMTLGGSGLRWLSNTSAGSVSTTLLIECHLCGDSGRIFVTMWEATYPNYTQQCMFCVTRSVNSSGVRTGSYFTTFYGGDDNTGAGIRQYSTLAAGVALPTNIGCLAAVSTGPPSGYQNIPNGPGGSTLLPVYPYIGYLDNPHLDILIAPQGNYINGCSVSVTIYGAAHTYLVFTANGTAAGTNWYLTNARANSIALSDVLFLYE